ncbi:MAG: VanZ family protein [Burkholderiales bacterium]|nr:VanZ family protein [Burkholderiales bacterium]
MPVYLAIAYVLLIVLASLSPFTGWRDSGAPVLAFLFETARNYQTRFDLMINILGYAPIGFLFGMWALSRLRPAFAVLLAGLGGGLLSLAMESLQSYLPTRISSVVDFVCNSTGAFAGALLAALLGWRLLESRRLSAVRHQFFYPGAATPAGLVLLGFWLLSQTNPSISLFGNGDLRVWLGEDSVEFHSAQFFIWAETAVVALNLLGAGLLAANLTANNASAGRFIFALLAAVFTVKSSAVGVIVDADRAFAWLTFGAWLGLLAGGASLIVLIRLERRKRFVIAFASLALATALVNFLPMNPYLISSFELWREGQYLNLNASTRFVSALWPFAAMLYLATHSARRESLYT